MDTIHDVLELGGGAGQLHTFIERYEKYVSEFTHAPLAFPVIVLVDNDDGGKKLFGLAKSRSGEAHISFKSTNPFYYLGLNLYMIKTPEQIAAPHKSYVETFFGATVLSTKLDGKTFDPNKEHEAPGKYGKALFATRVVEPNASTIDFSGFSPLLDRIVAVLDHHAKLKAKPLAAAS